jgi:protein-disulfide isomerase
MTEENSTEKTTKTTEKITNNNMWRYTTIALIAIVVLLLAAFLWQPGESGATGRMLTLAEQNDIANKTIDFLNKNIITGDNKASFDSVSETSGILNITVNYQDRKIPIYTTADGKFLILSAPIDTTASISQPEEEQQEPTETPKTDKPTVQLFVMAFCPYGIQAESAMKPVVDLLGSKADIQVHFIANVGGTTPDSVQSLHGTVEAQEDLRQVCIMKYYDQKTYWNYVMTINANCSSKYRDATYDACWKDAATKAGIDASKIDTCSKGEGVTLLKADDDLSSSLGVSGSPTLIINGVTYSGARTPDAYKEGVCNAFTTSPSECSQQLSTTGSQASGGCAT